MVLPRHLAQIVTVISREFRKSRGGRARRAPLYPRRAPYGRQSSRRDFLSLEAPEGALQLHFPCNTWRDFSEELFVVRGRLRAIDGALQLNFLCKHSRLEGAEQSQRAPSAPKGGMAQCPPAYAPHGEDSRTHLAQILVVMVFSSISMFSGASTSTSNVGSTYSSTEKPFP